jgi:hypothetical protein
MLSPESALNRIPALVKLRSGPMRGDCYIAGDMVFSSKNEALVPALLEWVDSTDSGRAAISSGTWAYDLLDSPLVEEFVSQVRAHDRALTAAAAGAVKSEKKAKSSRENAKKGGRPPKGLLIKIPK